MPDEPDVSYRGQHTPHGPDGEDSVRLDNVTRSITGEEAGYPDDFYGKDGKRLYAPGPRFKGDEHGKANSESYAIIMKAKDNPDMEVTIYRAVPNDDTITTINRGDFVTLSKTYADLHAASGYGHSGDAAGKVLVKKVPVRDVYFDGNDVN